MGKQRKPEEKQSRPMGKQRKSMEKQITLGKGK